VLSVSRDARSSRRAGVGAERRGPLPEYESEDDNDDDDALKRVHDDPHPRALESPRGISEGEDVHQGGGYHPRGVQVVEREQHPIGDKVAPSKDAPHARQQKPPPEQLLAEHRVEDGEHDDHREPAPLSPEEVLATVGAQELGEVPSTRIP
jgi:hypothetical protein